MKFHLIVFFLFLFHGNDVAKFTFYKENKVISVLVALEAEDLASALQTKPANITKKQIEQYLLKHVTYSINDAVNSFYVNDIQLNIDHFIIETTLSKKVNTISSLKITNTALTEVNSKQSNIIELRFNDMYRDFLIDKNNSTLNIKL